jgi:glycosyltransferase involved in cell wall biosynthesis
VDSASTDASGEIMRAVRSPDVSFVRVAAPGLARAQNAGWPAAAGKAVLFTDDDVVVPPAWAERMSPPLLAGYDMVAGAVHLPDSIAAALTDRQREFSPTPGSSTSAGTSRDGDRREHGLRRALADLSFAFDVRLGAGALGFYEETLLLLQLTEAGGRALFVGDVPAVNHIDSDRLTPQAWERRARDAGIGEGWLNHNVPQRARAGATLRSPGAPLWSRLRPRL